jgi:hypothetical protein
MKFEIPFKYHCGSIETFSSGLPISPENGGKAASFFTQSARVLCDCLIRGIHLRLRNHATHLAETKLRPRRPFTRA